MFCHLHTHSYFSFLDGLASPRQLAQAAAQANMPALALTDLHMLSGAVEFYDACLELGIKPVLGLEIKIVPPFGLHVNESGSLILLAMDLNGWASLCRLSSAVNQGQERLTFEQLAQDANGLICLSGGLRGLAAKIRQVPDLPQVEKDAANLRRLLWFNTGLDVLYGAGGAARLLTLGQAEAFARGSGLGILGQGGFLFLPCRHQVFR